MRLRVIEELLSWMMSYNVRNACMALTSMNEEAFISVG